TPKTGVTSMALVYGLGALVTGAYVFKRKKK
ncbi:MAG TPA: LPXTG cell wall anchor domain-containing protein, partial [Clostridiales bacterium]|nr:LPXTG cell wall anchor domain-containing protein [Clostridiales bacterium]